MKKLYLLLLILPLGLVASCDNNDSSETLCPDVKLASGGAVEVQAGCTGSFCTDVQLAELEQIMSDSLTSMPIDTDFTLMLESADGRIFSVSTGTSSSTTLYRSASTSKLVTAVVILWLIEQGNTSLTLDSQPQDFISFWTPAIGSPASRVTLRHLLSFTSGFSKTTAEGQWISCLDRPLVGFESCVQEIYDLNKGNNIEPGSQYYYESSHLQIAGLMAIKAGGFGSWTELFNQFKTDTTLFSDSRYDLPSATNPRLAGGMHWTAEDYLDFLQALTSGAILSENMSDKLWASQRAEAAVVVSPVLAEMGEDWGYGLGNWVECKSPSFNCGSGLSRNSSPGAYGAYPFVDFENQYYGILAREGQLGTFPEGIDLFRSVEDTAKKWATRFCGI